MKKESLKEDITVLLNENQTKEVAWYFAKSLGRSFLPLFILTSTLYMTVVTINNKEHRSMCFCNKSYLTKAVILQYVNMSAYFRVIVTNKPGTSWNSRAGVSLKARFTKRNKKKMTFETVPVRRSDVASYCLTTYGPLLHVVASECHLIAHVLLIRTA